MVDIKTPQSRKLMNFALTILDFYIPSPVRKRAIRELLSITARAFEAVPPPTRGLSARGLLRSYAVFTRHESERVWAENRDEGEVERRLFRNALELGAQLRKQFRVRSSGDVIQLSRFLYRVLSISFEGRPDGQVIIRDCFFSRFYTGRICRLISALDAGVAAGISAGGKLEFRQRITEGHDCCVARIDFKGGPL